MAVYNDPTRWFWVIVKDVGEEAKRLGIPPDVMNGVGYPTYAAAYAERAKIEKIDPNGNYMLKRRSVKVYSHFAPGLIPEARVS